MATSHEIKCIHKSDRPGVHQRIINIGGLNADGTRWELPQAKAIDGIEQGIWKFYVFNNSRRFNVIIARSAAGYKYLKTEVDNTQTNNLLLLPECPS